MAGVMRYDGDSDTDANVDLLSSDPEGYDHYFEKCRWRNEKRAEIKRRVAEYSAEIKRRAATFIFHFE